MITLTQNYGKYRLGDIGRVLRKNGEKLVIVMAETGEIAIFPCEVVRSL